MNITKKELIKIGKDEIRKIFYGAFLYTLEDGTEFVYRYETDKRKNVKEFATYAPSSYFGNFIREEKAIKRNERWTIQLNFELTANSL